MKLITQLCLLILVAASASHLARAQSPAEFALIPAGNFTMGSTNGEIQGNAPSVSVYVSAFHMAKHEVTKALWDEVRIWGAANGYTDLPAGGGKGANHPVQTIIWSSFVKWCNARSQKEGLTPCYNVSDAIYKTGNSSPSCNWSASGYRLPTEAEWEKAARGGLSGQRFPWGDTISQNLANYFSGTTYYTYDLGPSGHNAIGRIGGINPATSPVGSFAANSYGLYDMAGNVWEWCWDWYSASYYTDGASDPRGPASGTERVKRGGSWLHDAGYCRAGNRDRNTLSFATTNTGFRLARNVLGVAPNASTAIARQVEVLSATPQATVNPNGTASTAAFDYGTTTAYGNTATVILTPDNGTTDQNVEAVLTNLLPNTTYHYRIRAENSAGTATGQDAAFTTLPTPIVLIPGIAGSVLVLEPGSYQLWPSVLPFDILSLSLRPNPGLDIRAVDVVRSFATKHFYDNFINHLAPETGGKYKEFKLEGDPTRLASSYMIDHANANPTETRPTLFPFPYDWRHSNATQVEALHQYIGRIQELHGGAKVNVVAHSMGGLLLRRYMLEKGGERVDRVVTIASPFWGAPMAVYRMATGNFFDLPGLDPLNRGAMRRTLVTLPGAHELLPSDAYLQNAGISILSEDGWDLDGNGGTGESYSRPHFWNVFDDLIRRREAEIHPSLPFNVPSVLSSSFHTTRQDSSLQDAVASPPITVPTLHLFGRQIEDKTPIAVVAKARTVGVLNPKNEFYYDVIKGAGDETVPILSAERTTAYLWPGAITRPIWGQDDANHNELMSNQWVWDYVDDFLDDGLLNLSSQAAPSMTANVAEAAAAASSTPMKRILILGAGYVRIRDASGNTNAQVSDISATRIPGVDVRYGGDEPWVIIECAASNDLTIEKDSSSDSLEIEVTYLDTGGAATGLNRFRFAPHAAVWQMNLGSAQSPELKVDADNSGTLESTEVVAPTHTINGGTVDTTQPQVSLQLSVVGGMVTATLSGTDDAQPPNVFYTLNAAAPQAYSTPLAFPAGVEGHLKVFAEDAAGNTSGLIETTVNPNVVINKGTGSTITLTWPIADAYVLEETTTLAGDWVPSAAQVTRSGLTDTVSISTGTDTRRFFRLRSRTVTK